VGLVGAEQPRRRGAPLRGEPGPGGTPLLLQLQPSPVLGSASLTSWQPRLLHILGFCVTVQAGREEGTRKRVVA